MENKRFLTAQDVMEMLGVSLSYSYKLIRRLNAELEADTKVTNQSIGLLYYWLDKLHYEKMIHPYSVRELRKYGNPQMQELYDVKLEEYR